MKYSGIDLHWNNSVVSVTDEEARVVAEKRLPNDLTKIVSSSRPGARSSLRSLCPCAVPEPTPLP